MSTLETLTKLAKYAETLPDTRVRCDLACIVSSTSEICDTGIAYGHIEPYYGTPDKAPGWLRTIANAEPGNLAQACAEARAELAKELDSMEAENDQG